MKKPTFIDAGDFTENQRCEMIGRRADSGEVVAFIVETTEKADRYIKKILNKYPALYEVERFDGPVPDTITVKVAKRSN